MARQPSPSAAPHLYRWIVDGHNLLLSSPNWARLHGVGRGRAAREGLDRWIEAFGRAAGVQPWIVYDGADVGSTRELQDGPHLRVLFTDPPAEADDQIRVLVSAALRGGELVCVVSSDRRTLGTSLPPEARRLSVVEFRRLHNRTVKAPEKWVPNEDLDDVERHFLSASPFASDRAAAESGSDTDAPDSEGSAQPGAPEGPPEPPGPAKSTGSS